MKTDEYPPCIDCNLESDDACEYCDRPLCYRCENQNRGQCRDCAEAAAELNRAIVAYEGSLL